MNWNWYDRHKFTVYYSTIAWLAEVYDEWKPYLADLEVVKGEIERGIENGARIDTRSGKGISGTS